MIKLEKLLEDYANESLEHIVISHPRDKKNTVTRLKLRPVLIKGVLMFQETSYNGAKALHKNYDKIAMKDRVISLMEKDYVQIELTANEVKVIGLVNRKGELSLKLKKINDNKNSSMVPKSLLAHDRKKRRILREGQPVGFLVDLGLMTEEGHIVKAGFDKYKQINRFLEFIEDIVDELPKDREISVLDFGCGKSYLTFAVYYYLKELCNLDVRITGLDLKEDVIEKCNALRDRYGYEKLDFVCGDVADHFEKNPGGCDLMLTLHACDTATDYALYNAVMRGARVILSVPCCQHEINKQINSDILAPIMRYGLLKERMAALITDGVRAELLRAKGYDVSLLEFIDMEHTPKNVLIRAVKKENSEGSYSIPHNLTDMMDEMKIKPALYRMLMERDI
ncbi:MAG: SAM-dependent methyltransferase [Lachnospiraceae bacterium]|nr:SAM-dependent methyltransferase [Lachnospiraceae bacterium]